MLALSPVQTRPSFLPLPLSSLSLFPLSPSPFSVPLLSSHTPLSHMYTVLTHTHTWNPQVPWQALEAVGDQSAYVSSIVAHVRSTIPLIRENLTPARKYFVNFCHKLAKYVPNRTAHEISPVV